MRQGQENRSTQSRRVDQKDGKDASFQVIVMGSTGGPREDSVTGLLVRSTFTQWSKGSIIAVDAGCHLASIVRILENHLPSSSETIPPKGHEIILDHGPFAGLKLPYFSARANALHIFRELVHSFLITHPHLDHLAALGINTPALEYGREAKAVVALPKVIDAIKAHIFNDLIWPNLSDENEGVGFITYRRLIEGGNSRLGSGEGRGYVSVCNGILTKCWTISHGKCKRRGSISHQHSSSFGIPGDNYTFPPRTSEDQAYYTPGSGVLFDAGQGRPSLPGTPGQAGFASGSDPNFAPVDSSAFFLRNETDGSEIIVFGDVEPDTISVHPRNYLVWEDAAQKFAIGSLKAVFIECSYADSVRDSDLYGHLCPRHLIAELHSLATKVMALKGRTASETAENLQEPPSPSAKKRKRTADLGSERPSSPKIVAAGRRSKSRSRQKSLGRQGAFAVPASPKSFFDQVEVDIDGTGSTEKLPFPLAGLQVHIIHVKDTLTDGPQPKDIILGQLKEQGEAIGLGCDFNVTKCGQEIWL